MVSADGVRAAADRIAGKAVRTPLLENAILNDRAGGRILLKPEMLQHYGSFKFRGAYNLISQLSPEQRKAGVLAWSSGNHAQGVAYAAKLMGVKATILMPEDAPAIKLRNVRALGAEIITYDRYTEDREEVGGKIMAERGLALAPPFDHPHTIEGQGTAALEVYEDAKARGLTLEAFITCCGGGGLTAGSAVILEDVSPGTKVWIAEPEGFDETWASIRDGARCRADVSQHTICDALASPTPGKLTLPIMERLVCGGVALTEDEVRDAMVFAHQTLKLTVEPGGAVALAAILSGKFEAKGKIVALTLSGGNVDAGLFAAVLENRPIPTAR
ncbi:pyridoxal-5'-phosphate-dependent protein [Marinicaulis flavus]|uniref:Pyridoxal-5'-phosphate-dependent protein n=2 Tax=Hyphococcus luteus TaxID=2058213 RepID=A0A2S7KB67_9PROT|nr:pyridoxal-5'-phosphate-dependent protein [Marinicaulis flavus]